MEEQIDSGYSAYVKGVVDVGGGGGGGAKRDSQLSPLPSKPRKKYDDKIVIFLLALKILLFAL